MRCYSLLLALLLLLPSFGFSSPPHLDKAKSYLGVKEVAPNDGPEVKLFLYSVGITHPAPWCAAFVGYCLTDAGAVSPKPSALALHYITLQSWKPETYLYHWRKGDVFVMRQGESWKGHTGFIDSVYSLDSRLHFVTIEGNTGPQPGSVAQERDGDGVYARDRVYQPWAYFRMIRFTPVTYRQAG